MHTQFAVTQPSMQPTPVQTWWFLGAGSPLARLALAGGAVGTAHAGARPDVITVDADAPGPLHDGLSWTTAYTTVQHALDLANTNGGVNYEVWVAEGTYYPDEGGGHVNNVASESFRLAWEERGAPRRLCGDRGGTPCAPSAYWTVHPTYSSGDIDQNDVLAGNVYRVFYLDGVTNEAITAATVIDGFTVTGGNATGSDPDDRGGARPRRHWQRAHVQPDPDQRYLQRGYLPITAAGCSMMATTVAPAARP